MNRFYKFMCRYNVFFFPLKGGGIMWFSGAHNSSLKKFEISSFCYTFTGTEQHVLIFTDTRVSNLQNLQKLYDDILVKTIFYSYSYFLQMRLLTESTSLDSGLQHKKKRI